MLGSTRMMSDGSGYEVPGSAEAYTAFGQRVCSLTGGCDPASPPQRFGYAGEWGYQAPTSYEQNEGIEGRADSSSTGDALELISSGAADPYVSDFPFLHVGHRYYDPATGRFLQRDPIGIEGGLNVYEYARSVPTRLVDADGMIPIELPPSIDWPPVRPMPPKPPAKPPSPEEELERIRRRIRYLRGGLACAGAALGAMLGGPGGAAAGAAVGGIGPDLLEDVIELW